MNRITSILIISSIFCMSCKDEVDQIETSQVETKLKLDTKEIKVDAKKVKKTIKVESNSDYIVKSEKSWVKVLENKDKTKIDIEISENTTKEERFGAVVVSTVDKKKKAVINVYQGGIYVTPKLIIPVTNIEVKSSPDPANCKIDLTANTDYETKVSVDWIEVIESTMTRTKVTFKVKNNNTGSKRTGVISFFIDGELKKSVNIKQAANASSSYVEPAYNFALTEGEIKDFETDRGNVLIDTTTLDGGQTTILKYNIEDSIFGQISYVINLNLYKKVALYTKNPIIDATDKEKYEESLLAEGYEKFTEKGYLTTMDVIKVDKVKFVNKVNGTKIEYMADKRANHYVVTYFPVQPYPSNVLSALPSFTKWDSKANIESFESSNKGLLDDKNSKFDYTYKGVTKDKLFYRVSNGADDLVAREYYIAKSGGANTGVTQRSFYYNDRSLAFYTGKDGESYLTDEFKKLAKDNGFTFSKVTSKKSHIFKKGNLTLAISDYKHPAYYDKVIRLNLY